MKSAIIIALSMIVGFANAQDHKHHGHHTKAKTQTVSSKQFIPPDDLKVRMEKIVEQVRELSKKKDDLKSVKEYGDKIEDTVSDIFKTCKLEPDADAAIHPALGQILSGTKDFKDGKYESGHKKIHEALLEYEKLFKHEGWKH